MWDPCDISLEIRQTSVNIVSFDFVNFNLFLSLLFSFEYCSCGSVVYCSECVKLSLKCSMVSSCGLDFLSTLKITGVFSMSSRSGCRLLARLS